MEIIGINGNHLESLGINENHLESLGIKGDQSQPIRSLASNKLVKIKVNFTQTSKLNSLISSCQQRDDSIFAIHAIVYRLCYIQGNYNRKQRLRHSCVDLFSLLLSYIYPFTRHKTKRKNLSRVLI